MIIENQLEATSHDHLRNLLADTAGYDDYTAVWSTREFRDEHGQALDWLNQRTGDDMQFFGVVAEDWRPDSIQAGIRPSPARIGKVVLNRSH
jgi:hypothetical protein